jgi:hypothetical protein
MSEAPEKIMSEMFDQATETFNLAIRNGVRMQEEASRWFNGMLGSTATMQTWQREVQDAERETAPIIQKTMQEGLKALDRGWRSGLELLKKAVDAGQSAAAMQSKAQALWEASLSTFRTECQAMAEANARAMEMWTELARGNAENMALAGREMAGMVRSANGGYGQAAYEKKSNGSGSQGKAKSKGRKGK